MVKDKALRLRELIARARAAPLEGPERAEYEKLRRTLADGYTLAQKLTLRPGQMQRRSRRVHGMDQVGMPDRPSASRLAAPPRIAVARRPAAARTSAAGSAGAW